MEQLITSFEIMFSIVGSANALLLYLTTSGTQFVVVIFGISLWGKIGKR